MSKCYNGVYKYLEQFFYSSYKLSLLVDQHPITLLPSATAAYIAQSATSTRLHLNMLTNKLK